MSKRPPNHPVHTERTVMRALQTFYIFIYCTCGLSDGDACPFLGGPSTPDRYPTEMTEGLSQASVDMAAQDRCHDRCTCHPVRLRDEGMLMSEHVGL
jgi:hypothetical protein